MDLHSLQGQDLFHQRFPTGSLIKRNRQEEPLPPWFSQYVKDKVVTECLKQVHECVENWLEAAKK